MKDPDPDEILVSKIVQLEKFPGKGGWTFVRMEEIPQDKQNPFGWKKVKGRIDEVTIAQYHLMPMGNGHLFLPVKASIRKKIKKEEGDWVEVVLFADNDPLEIPKAFIDCLKDAPPAWEFFMELAEKEQQKWVHWIYAVKKEELKVKRISDSIEKILEKKKH